MITSMCRNSETGRPSRPFHVLALALAACWLISPGALAGPNLVANGDLNRPDQEATARVGLGGKAIYFAFEGEGDFGQVVATVADGSANALRDDLRVAYVELGRAATGGQRGLLIDTSNLGNRGGIEVSVRFDLQGKIRPNKQYEWSITAAIFGASNRAVEGFRIVAPALWADGVPLGTEAEAAFDAYPIPRTGLVTMRDFNQETGKASMILMLPPGMSEQFLIAKASLREVDEALLRGEQSEMPVPVRYIPLADPIEFRIAEALDKSGDFLRGLQDRRTGGWRVGDLESSIQLTAAATSALIEIDGRPSDEEDPLALSLDWLGEQLPEELEEGEADNRQRRLERDLHRTAVVAERLYCLAKYGDPKNPKHIQAIAHDVTWLEEAQMADGGWADVHRDLDEAKAMHSDNTTSATALLALREAFFAGRPCNRQVWIDAAKYWVAARASDGGYRAKMDVYGGASQSTTVRHTAAGVASLLSTMDLAFAAGGNDCEQFRKNRAQLRALREGFGWLDAHYTGGIFKRIYSGLQIRIADFASGGLDPFSEAAYMLRLGNISGRNRIGKKDHVIENARVLLDGRFYDRGSAQFVGDPLITAHALATLAEVDSPTVLQRIVIGGDDGHEFARDAEHVIRYLSKRRGEGLNWRSTSIDRPLRELVAVPIMYLNFAGQSDWSPEQWAKLRDYCFAGGVVLINIAEEAAASRGEIESALQTVFPEYRLTELAAADPILTARVNVDLERRPQVIGNGVKNLVFILPEDWSCTWHRYQHRDHPERYDFVDNLLEYTTDGEELRGTFAESHWSESAEGARTLPVARLECGGEMPAYPDSIKLLDRLMRAHYRSAVTNATAGGDQPILLWLANVGEKPLSDDELTKIRQALDEDAYLFAEVVGGDADWAETFRVQLQRIDPKLEVRRLPVSHAIFTGMIEGTGGFDVRHARLSKTLRQDAGSTGRCDLYLLEIDGREVGVLSQYDVSGSMHYVEHPGRRGPAPEAGRHMAMNVVLHALYRSIQ